MDEAAAVREPEDAGGADVVAQKPQAGAGTSTGSSVADQLQEMGPV